MTSMPVPEADRHPPALGRHLFNLLIDSPDLDAYLGEVVRLIADVVTPAAGCAITAQRDGRPFTLSSSNDIARRIDELQYDAGHGPCLDALRTGTVVQVDDLVRDGRWDTYRDGAAARGIASSLAVPLTVDGETVASLNLYASAPGAFDGPHRMHAVAFGAQCSAALRLALSQLHSAQVQQHLGPALESRSVIDQAIGILMGQQGCTAAAGFDALRRASQRTNRKLRDIARDLIARTAIDRPMAGERHG
jgi:GAF domain-containing protein